ncbi:hypothetical protein F4804DRAFT_317070 [Jackrogersella minutella]|nr:hypothetical protein F4804DRAFT_317070 [Jackrogersella minutella]
MERQPYDLEEGHSSHNGHDYPLQQSAHTLIRLIRNSIQPYRTPHQDSYHASLSNIPITSPERLALASPDSPDGASVSTILYLAYGANLSKSVLDRHDIQPISQINVSAPAFDLAFDLPGLPYWEPCFSNLTPRKIPKLPIPGDPPKPPFDPPRVDYDQQGEIVGDKEKCLGLVLPPSLPPGIPSWDKGLYGVVYELTRDDYRKIIKMEGNGSLYHDILAPCIALPPPLNIPEKPPIPELPKPFIAHTLYSPRLPSLKPPGGDDGDNDGDSDNNGDDGEDDPRNKKWWQKLLLPVRRSNAGYAQPSARYLQLIRGGAREHYLPDDYQHYLARLEAYTITTWLQDVGRWLLLFTVLPFFLLILGLGFLLADKDDKVPRWLNAASAILANLAWTAYDAIFKPLFGDGERTIEEDDDDSGSGRIRDQGTVPDSPVWGNEKNALLVDW